MTVLSPLFKGDKKAPKGPNELSERQQNEKLMSGIDSVTCKPLQPDQYLAVIRDVMQHNRQLCENVARVFATNFGAHQMGGAHRFYVEGCLWDWGTMERYGADILQQIENVIPAELRKGLPLPVVIPHSNRTRNEVEKIMDLAEEHNQSVVAILTHHYHKTRAEQIAREVHDDMSGGKIRPVVYTPMYFVRARRKSGRQLQPSEQFLIDVIEAAQPTDATKGEEERMERRLLRPLHWGSRKLELFARKVGISFDLEGFIADNMPGRKR